MKLEMRVFNLDVCVELDDDQYYDQLEVLENVKSLVRSLEQFDSVYLHVETVREDAEEEVVEVEGSPISDDVEPYRFAEDQAATTDKQAA
jgi:hypothetical protein